MKKLILLHGALGAASQFDSLVSELEKDFTLWIPDLPMHGENGLKFDLSMSALADYILQQLDEKQWNEVSIFGYSMGGYLALMMATIRPGLFEKIVTLGTKFEWTEDIGRKQSAMLNPDSMQAKVPMYASYLDSLHKAFSWRYVVESTANMLLQLGENPPLTASTLPQINTPCIVCIGDGDQMVSKEEADWACTHLPNAQMKILTNTPHPLEKVNAQVLLEVIRSEFL